MATLKQIEKQVQETKTYTMEAIDQMAIFECAKHIEALTDTKTAEKIYNANMESNNATAVKLALLEEVKKQGLLV